jgi:phycocyanobilin lyase subunit alpha
MHNSDDNNQAMAPAITLEEAIANLKSDDGGLRFYAAWWLGRFRVTLPEGVDLLIEALQDERDRTEEGGYPLRRNAARALGKIGNLKAVSGLIASLDCSDYYVREAAAESLGQLGDPQAIAPLVALLQLGIADQQLIPDQPMLFQPYDALLEALGALQAMDRLCSAPDPSVQALVAYFLQHPTPRVQYAAHRAMYQFTQEAQYGDRLVAALQGNDLQLRRAALSDIGAIGYVPGANAIAQTLAENSVKLIAMKGLLETQVKRHPQGARSPDAIDIMDLMDSLL